jgi:hypothetical protein
MAVIDEMINPLALVEVFKAYKKASEDIQMEKVA